MAKLYFRYGAMGSSKTANAIMVRYNYMERGQKALILKPALERRDGVKRVSSRSGLSAPCAYIEELHAIDLSEYDCLIVDEAQFLTKAQVAELVDIVETRNLPVICYGLRADFKGELFPGSLWLMAWADTIEEVKTVCWCGRKATCNARIQNGRVVKTGEQVQLGGNESYVSLCRKHWREGNLGNMEIRRIDHGKRRYLPLLLLADPDERMIERYLDDGALYVLFEGGEPVAEAVVQTLPDGTVELANLATDPEKQRRGFGAKLMRHLFELYKSAGRMLVGTGGAAVGFYEAIGFTVERVEPGYFSTHYDEPLYDAGVRLCDRVILSRVL